MLRSLTKKILVVESDPQNAVAIANLALETLPPHAEGIVAKASSTTGAKRLIDELSTSAAASDVIVICASDLDNEGSGLDVLAYARTHHPHMRAVILTDGEVRDLALAVELGVHGIHERRSGVEGLRSILSFLGKDPAPALPTVTHVDQHSASIEAERALEGALARVQAARAGLELAGRLLAGEARAKVLEAERHALAAHRRLIEAERALRENATTN